MEGIEFINLSKEILPNGKVVKYSYSENKILIESFNPSEKHLYASLILDTATFPNQLLIHDWFRKGTCGEYKNSKGEYRGGTRGVPYMAVTSTRFASHYVGKCGGVERGLGADIHRARAGAAAQWTKLAAG